MPLQFINRLNEEQIIELINYENKIGEEYLNALREYYAMEAEKEIARIKGTLGVGRS